MELPSTSVRRLHRRRLWQRFTIGFLALACGGSLHAATPKPADVPVEQRDYSDELPRILPKTVEEALKTIEVAPGFKIQRIAQEPLVTSPVAMCFDEHGKLYVVEMRDYSEQINDQLGRITVLEDLDNDGVFDKSTVLTEGLSWPTAVIAYKGGVFVGAAPDLWYFKDHDGDGKADEKRLVFTGFGKTNVQGLVNSFRWGQDNRIHGATSSSGGVMTRPDDQTFQAVQLRGRDFSFDPEKLDLRAESGGAQHGMYFDDWGRKFVCSNSVHAQQVVFDDHYMERNKFFVGPNPRIDIAVDGGQATVFRSSPVEPWRIVRTRLRVSGEVKGAVEGGGRAAGYFTGATGITIYRGDALGDDMKGVAIIGDVGSNIVHRKQLIENGVTFKAQRIDDQNEFVRSTDIWFRPVQFSNGPDGCFHILDMYREMIEHPLSIPEVIKKHLDTSSGQFKGRLYRVTPENFKHRPTPIMAKMTTADLVPFLQHANSWHRETANRLIYERQDKSVIPQLHQIAIDASNPLGQLHALSALHGLNAVTEADVMAALNSPESQLRAKAIAYAEEFPKSKAISDRLTALVNDEHLPVRFQLALSAGEFPEQLRTPWLITLAKRDGGDTWMQAAVQSSLGEGAGTLTQALLSDATVQQNATFAPFLMKLTQQILRQDREGEIDALVQTIAKLPTQNQALRNALFTEGLKTGGQKFSSRIQGTPLESLLESLLKSQRAIVSQKGPAARRIAAIDTLKLSAASDDLKLLTSLLTPAEDPAIQTAALTALRSQSSDSIAVNLLDQWSRLAPAIRLQAEELLFSRPSWTALIFDRLEQGTLPAASINSARLAAVAASGNKALQERAKKLVNTGSSQSKSDIVNRYLAAQNLTGNKDRGRQLFKTHCATCHRLEDVGVDVGPSLAAIQNRGRESIVMNVLDPNREVNPDYLNYVVVLEDGRALTGMIRGETATSITLIRAENQKDELLRNEIEEIRSSGLSLMPEGFEKQLDEQAVADLVEYLMNFDK